MTDTVSPLGTGGVTYDNFGGAYGTAGEYDATFGGSYTAITGAAPAHGNTYAVINGGHCTLVTNCAALAAYQKDNTGQWYLPSIYELTLIKNLDYMFSENILTRPGSYSPLSTTGCNVGFCEYWSSTEYADLPAIAWLVNGSNGDVTNGDMNAHLGVRAVRAFTY